MNKAEMERKEAARLPEGDVVAILLEQHARIRDLFEDVKASEGVHKQQAFDELRALLAVHETAEEMIVRPVAQDTVGEKEAEARNHEEEEANKVLARLEKMDVASPEFDALLREFEQSVSDHAEREEREEFPGVHSGRSEEQLRSMGTRLRAAEKVAPTHPHPSAAGSPTAQWAVGPFASLVDRTRDAINAATGG
ncbi:hemerythrin domain-containing protein [Streptomyces hygroscopicus]|uniref:hemerythrin domain-containing protein n=1 Tax=Streptomyces hygroscopicus TaxID=1912 RepID=UPI000767299B|nr:hemerythrin domain-containing protein [Streptomyces hygroscopicus]MBW8093600.1 hemerythrin domain-containing protein [Streptomyces hygroscopicus subsp. hygroscopicus]